MEMLPIIKGIPIPDARADAAYPFASMEVGDCFDVPRCGRAKDKRDLAQRSIISCAWQWRHSKRGNRDAQFKTKIIDETTVRCWRKK